MRSHQDPAVLANRFARELGRVIGTDADPQFWASHFDITAKEALDVIQALKITGRARETAGRLYAR